MKSLFVCLVTLSVVTLSFAGGNCCGSSSSCGNSCYDRCGGPDWGYAYNDAHYIPNCAPCELKKFHNKMIPMMEARGHAESAYVREYSCDLYTAAKKVPGSLDCDSGNQRKYYNKAAHDLVKDCKELYVMSYGAPSHELYSLMHDIESDYLRLANLSDN